MPIFSLLMKVSEPKYCQLCEINVTSEISLLEFSSTANIKCLDFKINLQGFRQAVIGAGKGTLEDFENLIQLNHGT